MSIMDRKQLDEYVEHLRKLVNDYDNGIMTRGEVYGSAGYKFILIACDNYKDGDTIKLKFRNGGRFIFTGDDCDIVDAEEVHDI